MKILTKHLLKEFFKPLFFLFVIFVGLSIISDFLRELNLFMEKKSPAITILKYLVFINVNKAFLILPIAVLLAVLFSLSSMARSGELTAVKIAGLNLKKILMPLFLSGFLLSVFVFFAMFYLVPPIAKRGYAIRQNEILKLAHTSPKQKWKFSIKLSDATECEKHVHIGFIDLEDKIMQDVSIYEYDKNKHIISHILAKKALWDGKRWKLFEGIKRIHRSSNLISEKKFASLNDEIIPPPEYFVFDIPYPEEMTLNEHKKLLDKLNTIGAATNRAIIQFLYRISSAFSNFIVIFIGVYFATTISPRHGKIFGFTAALFLAFLYYGITAIGQSLGEIGALPPLVAAWFGNIIYGGIGIFLYKKIPT